MTLKTHLTRPHENCLSPNMKTATRITKILTAITALPLFLLAAPSVQAQSPTTTTLSPTGTNTSPYGTSVTLTATVSSAWSGDSVVFSTNEVPIATNTIISSLETSLTISNLQVGTYSITATYLGDTNPIDPFDPSTSAPSTEVITPLSVTIVSGLSVDSVFYGTLSGLDAATLTSNNVVLAGVLDQDLANVYLVTNGYSSLFTDTNANPAVPVTVSGLTLAGSAATNYSLVEPSLTGDIEPAVLSYVATAANQPFGSPNSNFTGTVTGFEYSDTQSNATIGTLAFASTTTSASPVGSYPILGSGLSASNYIFSQAGANATALTITAGTVTIVSGLTADDKVYDGTNTATLSVTNAVVFAGLAPADVGSVTLNTNGYLATFATNSATTNIAVTVSGLTLAGVDATNYILTQPEFVAAITPAPVTVTSGLTVAPVEYGTLSGVDEATLTSNNVVLAGVVAQDVGNVFLETNGYTAVFTDINANAAVPVTVSGMTLGGSVATNYSLTEPTLSGEIDPATLTYLATPASQPYGTPNTNFTGTVTGFAYSDTESNATLGTLAFASATTAASAPGAYPIIGSGLSASNYVFAQAAGNATALTITAGTVTIVSGLTADDKVYDGTNTATLSVTNAVVFAGLAPADVGSVTLNTNGYLATFATNSATTNIAVTVSGLTLAGVDATNYILTQPEFAAAITPAPVTVTSGLTVASVEYGTLSGVDEATLTSNNVVLAGVVAQDVGNVFLETNGYTAVFTDINANAAVPVTVSGMALGGSVATNYSLTEPTLSGEIDPATLTYVATPASQPYGAPNTNFTGTVTGFAYSDTESNATLGTLAFASATTSASAPGAYPIIGSGLSASNYVFAQAAGNATALTITAGTVTIVSGLTADDKVYDGTNTATLSVTNTVVFAGLAPADVGSITLNTNGYLATFASTNATTNIAVTVSGLTLAGVDATNYILTQPEFVAAITPAPVMVTSGLAVAPVEYGTLSGVDEATLTSNNVVLAGVVAQDVGNVFLETNGYIALFTDINANAAVPVTVSGMTLGGSVATNYSLTEPTLSGEIDPATLTYVATPASQPYGAPNTNFTGTVTGFAYSDTESNATLGTLAFASATTSASAPGAYPIIGSGLSASNYVFTQAGANATALTITAGTVTIVSGLTADAKVYDGTNTATLSVTNTVVFAGLAPADVGSITLNTNGYLATFASTNATTNIAVTVSGLTLAGVDSTNYILTQPEFAAAITPAPVTITSGLTVAPVEYGTLSGLDAATLSSNNVVLAGVVAANIGFVYLDTNGYTAVFTDTNVNPAVPVTVSGLSLAGSEATNYSLTLPSLTGAIEPATLTYVATPASQPYGTPNTNFTGTVTGFEYSDTQSSATLGTLAFTSTTTAASPPGTYAIDGMGLTASNYVFQQATSNATALTITVSTIPVNLSFTLGTNQFTLTWPADHLGWKLQTNSIDLSNPSDWFDYPGSTTTTNETITLDPTQTSVYFRIVDQ